MKKRAILILQGCGILIACGVVYYILYSLTDLGIICPLNFTTGLLCPLCGSTRMIISLIRLDFDAAFYYNAVFLICLPLWLVLCALHCYNYVKTGEKQMKKWMQIVLYSTFAVMLIFGILRNTMDLRLFPSSDFPITFFGG